MKKEHSEIMSFSNSNMASYMTGNKEKDKTINSNNGRDNSGANGANRGTNIRDSSEARLNAFQLSDFDLDVDMKMDFSNPSQDITRNFSSGVAEPFDTNVNALLSPSSGSYSADLNYQSLYKPDLPQQQVQQQQKQTPTLKVEQSGVFQWDDVLTPADRQHRPSLTNQFLSPRSNHDAANRSSGNDSNYSDTESSYHTPYLYPQDMVSSPAMSHLTANNDDFDDLLSVASMNSNYLLPVNSHGYKHISNLDELDDLLSLTYSDTNLLPASNNSDFSNSNNNNIATNAYNSTIENNTSKPAANQKMLLTIPTSSTPSPSTYAAPVTPIISIQEFNEGHFPVKNEDDGTLQLKLPDNDNYSGTNKNNLLRPNENDYANEALSDIDRSYEDIINGRKLKLKNQEEGLPKLRFPIIVSVVEDLQDQGVYRLTRRQNLSVQTERNCWKWLTSYLPAKMVTLTRNILTKIITLAITALPSVFIITTTKVTTIYQPITQKLSQILLILKVSWMMLITISVCF